jgi:hypothetical protein
MKSRSETNHSLARPATLKEGERYWLRLPAKKQGMFKLQPVRFISYTSCPAVVIIADKAGRLIRSARDDILSCI